MSQERILSIKTNRFYARSHKTQITKQNYQASDDVHRIAMRTPSLYQTKPVPQIRQLELS